MPESSTPWSRRSREKVRNPLLWVCGLIWIPVAFAVGLGVILDEERWWAQAIGGLVSLVSIAVGVLVAKFLRRPVRTYDEIAPVESDTVANWDAAMNSGGRVEIGLSPLRVATTFGGTIGVLLVSVLMISGVAGAVGIGIGALALIMMTFLALIPHLQFVSGGRPAVLIDSSGIEIARWGRLVIPWAEVEAVEVLQSTRKQSNTIVRVSPTFYSHDLASRFPLWRIVEMPARSFVSNAYAIPSTTTANSRTLAAWLAKETTRRRGQT